MSYIAGSMEPYEKLLRISEELKNLAHELKCPVVDDAVYAALARLGGRANQGLLTAVLQNDLGWGRDRIHRYLSDMVDGRRLSCEWGGDRKHVKYYYR